ncbi:hypothetical protein SAMN05443665_103571 [Actinomadura meyerae]|jgi:hypothetical protein|uniref:Uncharacterized protein n=1 Tax=Actinomadura meyerae TaxID=240840 RepID=A0A239N369_9ACTN|nr:hypothetical protein SAMN05443665_103571 [Actinomadura meyerae]
MCAVTDSAARVMAAAAYVRLRGRRPVLDPRVRAA